MRTADVHEVVTMGDVRAAYRHVTLPVETMSGSAHLSCPIDALA
jgi:hypothetical protein